MRLHHVFGTLPWKEGGVDAVAHIVRVRRAIDEREQLFVRVGTQHRVGTCDGGSEADGPESAAELDHALAPDKGWAVYDEPG